MATPSKFIFSRRVMVILACLLGGAPGGFAQPNPPQPANSAAPTYQAQSPSIGQRLQNAGRSVGNFVRRKFYGESSAVQQPAYQRPVSYRGPVYSLDVPAGGRPGSGSVPAYRSPPASDGTPHYVKPPAHETPAQAASKKSTKSGATIAATTATSKKRTVASSASSSRKHSSGATSPSYASAKPRTSEGAGKTATTSHAESSGASFASAPPPSYPTEPKMEAKLGSEVVPGFERKEATSSSGGIAPTIGGSDFDLSPSREMGSGAVSSSGAGQTRKSSADTAGSESKSTSGSFLVGKKTAKSGRVVSPYAPYNELDITGLPSGSLALDPTTQKVFQVP